MDIIEKLKAEEGNLQTITIYGGKGVFAYAYERSALALVMAVKPFQASLSYNRKLKQYYVTIGVPADKIKSYS